MSVGGLTTTNYLVSKRVYFLQFICSSHSYRWARFGQKKVSYVCFNFQLDICLFQPLELAKIMPDMHLCYHTTKQKSSIKLIFHILSQVVLFVPEKKQKPMEQETFWPFQR